MFLNADGRLTETRGRYHVVRQAVPDDGSGDRDGPAADGRQFHGRYQQTIGPSRADRGNVDQAGRHVGACVHRVEHSNSGKKVSIRFDYRYRIEFFDSIRFANLINLPLLH